MDSPLAAASSHGEIECGAVADAVAEYIDISVTVEYDDGIEFTDWEGLGILFDVGLVTSQYVDRRRMTVHATATDAFDEVARMEWCIADSDRLAYINWTGVDETFRRQGVGSCLRRFVMDSLEAHPAVNVVYSDAFSAGGRMLMQKQGFDPVDDDHELNMTVCNWHEKTV